MFKKKLEFVIESNNSQIKRNRERERGKLTARILKRVRKINKICVKNQENVCALAPGSDKTWEKKILMGEERTRSRKIVICVKKKKFFKHLSFCTQNKYLRGH